MPHVEVAGRPSVTQVIGQLKKDLDWWYRKFGFAECERYTRAAGEFGTRVHSIIETGFNVPDQKREVFLAQLALDWLAQTKFQVDGFEQHLQHPTLNYHGTVDFYGRCAGLDWVGDYKTSSRVDNITMPMQLAAYGQMLPTAPTHGVILRLEKDPNKRPQLEVREYGPDVLGVAWEMFKKLLDLWEYQNGR